jgi:LysR family glycine cleavage system transcriptional activator
MNRPRHRPLSIGPLRAFEAVARLSSFRAAGEELHLSQPAISRQIRSLEDELGAALFIRGTRHVELTGAGTTLLRVLLPLLQRLDGAVRQIRQARGRRHVSVTTFASFASQWLLPRLPAFQRDHPDIDIRISASDHMADPDDPELDLALRYGLPSHLPADPEAAAPLFGEHMTPVASPSLGVAPQPADLARHTLLEDDDPRPSAQYLSWAHWLALQGLPRLEPRGWLYLNYSYQKVQAALAGQGVALARLSLAIEPLARGELVEPFGPAGRVASPYAYWLVRWPGRRQRPEVADFEAWVLAEAARTREALAGVGAVDTLAAGEGPAERSRRTRDEGLRRSAAAPAAPE